MKIEESETPGGDYIYEPGGEQIYLSFFYGSQRTAVASLP